MCDLFVVMEICYLYLIMFYVLKWVYLVMDFWVVLLFNKILCEIIIYVCIN